MSANTPAESKRALRAAVLARRKLGHSCGHSHSQLLIDFAWENRVKTVACYISFDDEPSTNVFLRHCQMDERISLYVPRVNGESLEWVAFSSDQILHPLGMLEPTGLAADLQEVDLVVVPALAADKSGNRLGRGMGFYDRALIAIRAKNVVVVVHDDELVDLVPTESHDAPASTVCSCSELVQV